MHGSPGAPPIARARTAWFVFIALAILAWALTLQQSAAMGSATGTMGLALPFFLLLWVVMMIAMMFPSVAPTAIVWGSLISRKASGFVRAMRMAGFAFGYLAAWTAFGVVAFYALLAIAALTARLHDGTRWLGVVFFVFAGVYQLTPLKRVCLRHCRSPLMSLMRYAGYAGRIRDFRVGLNHGAYCVGCCWGLMALLIGAGAMSVSAMVLLSAVIFFEKIWLRGETLATVLGVVFLALAVAAVFYPALLPGLHPGVPEPRMQM